MLDSVTGMTSRNADHLDLERFSSVAILLLQGSCDVLHAVEQLSLIHI